MVKLCVKIFRNSSYRTHDMRMLLGPSYFAWGHIGVGVSACLLFRQIEDCWPWCISSACSISIEVLYLFVLRTATYISCTSCYKSHLLNVCLVFCCVHNKYICLRYEKFDHGCYICKKIDNLTVIFIIYLLLYWLALYSKILVTVFNVSDFRMYILPLPWVLLYVLY